MKAATAKAAAKAVKPSTSASAAPVAGHSDNQSPPFLRQPRGPDPVQLPQAPLRALPVGENHEREAFWTPRLSVGDDSDRVDGPRRFRSCAAAAVGSRRGGVERAEGFERGVRRGDVEPLSFFFC